MISFDTNIVVHAANANSPLQAKARDFLEDLGGQHGVVICELMLVEVFLKLCNQRIFEKPMSPKQAGTFCRVLRENTNWLLVESAPVMPGVWQWTNRRGFAFRRIIDIRLGLTLRHTGVENFATTNPRDFMGLGFEKVWNPLVAQD
jgi:predicted nucleic acid-binding protein